MDTNYPNECERHVALTVMRLVEERVDGGTISPPLDASPPHTRISGDDQNHLFNRRILILQKTLNRYRSGSTLSFHPVDHRPTSL